MRLVGFSAMGRRWSFFGLGLVLLTAAGPTRGWAEPVAVTSSEQPLALTDAIALALRAHPQAASAHANAEAAVARIGQARSAWLPQVNSITSSSGNYSYQTGAAAGRE